MIFATSLLPQSTAVRTAAPSASRGTAFALTALIGATTLAYTSSTFLPHTITSCEALPVYGIPGTNQERTFLAVKPDGVQRGLIGDIIARFEKRGYKLVGLKMVWPTLEMAQAHYADLSSKGFYDGLCKFFSSGE